MKRRTLLSTVSAAISPLSVGCLEDASASSLTGEEEPKPAKENGSTDTFRRTVSIATVDDIPENAPVEFEVTVAVDEISASGTAFLEITCTNIGDTDQSILPYYKGRSAFDGNPGILLYALEAADSPPEDYTPECIGDPGPTQGSVDFTEEGYQPTLQPGESHTHRYIIVNDPSVDGCFPSGEYRFERSQIFENPTDGELAFTWGFLIEIRDGQTEE